MVPKKPRKSYLIDIRPDLRKVLVQPIQLLKNKTHIGKTQILGPQIKQDQKIHRQKRLNKVRRTQLLPLSERNPRRIILSRQDLSRIFYCHPSKSSNGGSQLRPAFGPVVLVLKKSNNHCKTNGDSQNKAQNESHLSLGTKLQ